MAALAAQPKACPMAGPTAVAHLLAWLGAARSPPPPRVPPARTSPECRRGCAGRQLYCHHQGPGRAAEVALHEAGEAHVAMSVAAVLRQDAAVPPRAPGALPLGEPGALQGLPELRGRACNVVQPRGRVEHVALAR